MLFEWNENKRLSNLRKHGIDFRDAACVFAGATLTIADRRGLYPEERFHTAGLLEGRTVLIVHTESDSTVRIISMREANRSETESFFNALFD